MAAALPGLARLQMRTDGAALVPTTAPGVVTDRQVRRHFGLRDPLLVLLRTEHPDGIFNPGTLGRLAELTRRLQQLDAIDTEHVVSLATERSPRIDPRTRGFQALLEPPPVSPERLAEVRREVDAAKVFHGTLVSFDRSTAVAIVGVPEGGEVDRSELYRRIADTARASAGDGHRVSVVGAPAAEALLGDHILRDLALLIPLVFAVVALVLRWACGRSSASLVGMVKVGAAQLFTFGLLGWSGEPVYLTTAMVPVILATIGIADEVHLLWSFFRRPAGEPVLAAIDRTLGELARPVVFTSLTTAAGFLTFASSSIRPVASMGLFTAFGVVFSMLWSLTMTPALLALTSRRAPEARAGIRARLPSLALAPAAARRWTVPLLAAGLGALALGLPRLSVQDSWIHNFSPDSPLRLATAEADRALAGTHALHLALTFDPPAEGIPQIPAASGPLLSGAAVEAVRRFEDELRALPEVGTVLGLASHLETTAFIWASYSEPARQRWQDPHWLHLHIRRLANVRGEARRRELVDDALRRTVVTVLLSGADYRRTEALVAAARRAELKHLAPVHARVELAGDLAVSQVMIPEIVRTQVRSLLLAIAACAVIASVLFRSLATGLLAVVPSAFGLLCTLGLLAWAGIPLGVATSMFCAVTLGIGVDFSLHLLARYRSAGQRGELHPGRYALTSAGPAILVDALAVTLGFGLLAASQVPPNRWLGLAVATALGSSALFTLAGTGALLLARDARRPLTARRGLEALGPSVREETG